MAPAVLLMICATPPLPLPPRLVAGQLMGEPGLSFHPSPEALTRKLEKLAVVPEESGRGAMAIAALGRLTPGLSALIAESFHVLIVPWKMPAMTGTDSFRLLTPDRLYETVTGAITSGK